MNPVKLTVVAGAVLVAGSCERPAAQESTGLEFTPVKVLERPMPRILDAPIIPTAETTDEIVVVTFSPDTTAARAYDRRIAERVLEFEPGAEPGHLLDIETRSTWDTKTGACLKGELQGTPLVPLPGIVSFRQAWEQFHPESSYHASE